MTLVASGLHGRVTVKVPLTPDGLAAGSPFRGRLDDNNEDGLTVVRESVSAYRQQSIQTKVLAASLRGPLHASQVALAGADIGSLPFKVLEAMFKHPLTDAGLATFAADYRKSQEEALASRPSTCGKP